ncbi:MAG: hypothetical protein IJ009_01655 [Clostridia bacterium]|nr:hypothetical protein [Clostridia bacterium]
MKKRILSLFLAVVMIVLAIPAVILPTLGATATNENGLYTASFSFKEDVYNYSLDQRESGKVTLKDNWEVGIMKTDVWNNGYLVSNAYNSQHSFVTTTGAGTWMNANTAGGYYVVAPGNSGNSGLIFSSEYDSAKDAAYPTQAPASANDRAWVKTLSNVLVRYTAEYKGTVTIDVAELVFKNNWSSMFAILVDGQPVGDFKSDTFNYATGAGWYDPETTDDVAGDISAVSVSVNKGSTIDFIFRGTENCDKTTVDGFTYSSCRFTSDNFQFNVTYTSANVESNATVESTFDVNDWGVWYQAADAAAAHNDPITQSGEWLLGYLPASYDVLTALNAGVGTDYSIASLNKILSIGTGFTAYSNNHRNKGSGQNFYGANNSGHNGAASGATGAFLQNGASYTHLQYCPGVYYPEEQSMIQYNASSGKYELSDTKYKDENGTLGWTRYATAFPSVASLRYVAEYGGNVTIDLTGSWHTSDVKGMAHLLVYVNGEYVKAITSDGSASAKTFNIIELKALAAGDTVDIVNVVDPRYGILMVTEKLDQVDAEGNVTGQVDNPWYDADYAADHAQWGGQDNARRGFKITSAKVTVTEPYYSATSTWDGLNAIASATLSDANYRLFQWYENATSTTALAVGDSLTAGTSVARINKDMIEAAGADWDTLTVADLLDTYVNYLISLGGIQYKNSAWAHGSADNNGKFSPIAYYGFFHGLNILQASGSKVKGMGVTQLVSADGLAEMVDSGWNGYGSGNKAGIAEYVIDSATGAVATDTSLVKNLTVTYDTAQDARLTKYAHNVIGCRTTGKGLSSIATLRPQHYFSANIGSAAFVYTAQADGAISAVFDNLNLTENAAFQWRISVNGEFISDVAEFTAAAVGDMTPAELASFNAQVAAVISGRSVKAGDKIGFHFARNANSYGVCVAPTISVTTTDLDVDVAADSNVNLSITDSYAVKLNVTPGVAGGTVEVLVDGAVAATMNPTNGYTYALKSGIKVSDLTASPTVADGVIDGTTVSYQLRETNGHYTITGATRSTTTNAMLSYYEGLKDDATAVKLAKNLRALAEVSNWIISDQKSGDLSDTTKNWIKCNGADNFSMRDLTTVDGNAVVTVNHGTKYSNWDSGLTDRTLATLQGYTAEDYYTNTNYWYTVEGDDTHRFAKFDPVEGVNALVKGENYGHVENVDNYDYVIAAANVNMGDKISIVLLIDATADADIWALKNEGHKLAVYDSANKKVIDDETGFAGVTVGGKDYIGVIVDVPISMYNETLTFVVEDASGSISAGLKYSVQTWCVNKYVFCSGSFQNYLVRAVYNLGVAAVEYQADHADA